ncbi:flavodoxin domain-containing protein [Brachybacterium fresconis]|uniref:Menaquinone-dependent protoporphyrinogen oxidase n=1 Tax=Brachybacterium fresconis TaxID=173363 RepID=A0ABS4YLJ2_9MICO|nr:flavodoxin domain-containing protein [Brachybacterium fresconis]MBP2409658.1 menaquinone-dependent protoporphyrinogen oxidase [Brachybacterium fresconis]
MTVLVAYATHSGATRTVAETLEETLRQEGLSPVLADIAEDPDPGGHEAAIIGSAVRVESFEKSFVRWVNRYSARLDELPLALFSCSGSAADPARGGRQKATDTFLESTGIEPVAVKNFPGWVLMDRIPVHEQLLLKTMRTPTGDFRDLPAVAAWAREIAPLLRR